jgi:GalNAc-alpha-(1->4)-GalNAc-alpha-(1->3)-diNAcBac-PP-undecaprenol alpha-1,4-N-acetyl-D-galactosaminyltransferase
MKAFIVIPTLTIGGAERVASILVNKWIDMGIEVHLVLLVGGEILYPLNEKVNIYSLKYPINLKGISKFYSLLKLFFVFRRICIEEKPDFVLSFMNKYNIFVLISLFRAQIRTIVSERDSPSEKLPFSTRFLRKKVYHWADGVLCQTDSSKDFIISETNNQNVISIPNPVKDFEISSCLKCENIILNVGRLVDKKGQKYLIESFSKVNNENWKLVFLGDGPLKNSLIKLTHDLNLTQKVVFNGNTRDVDYWYGRSSIFAFTSVLEGFPNALAEAMVFGLPSISFDCKTGPSEIINNGVNGFLVEEKNIEDFSKKLQLLMDDEVLRKTFSDESKKLGTRLNSDSIALEYLNFCK